MLALVVSCMNVIPTTTDTMAEILSRVIDPAVATFSPEGARDILKLDLSGSDKAQINELMAKARADSLTAAEERKLNAYLFIGQMLDLLHSKARLAVRNSDDAA